MAKIFNNPAMNDFVYTVLFQAGLDEKRGLKGKYLKAAMNGRVAKVFSTTSTDEEKKVILAHFGFEFFTVIAKRGIPLHKFRDILNKFETKKKVSALSDLAQEGVFVTSDKEFLRLMGLVSQTQHHPSYVLNLEMARQGYHIQKWSRKYENAEDKESREADATAKLMARTCLNASLLMEAPGSGGLTDAQLKILLVLFGMSHLYLSEEKLYGFLAGFVTKVKFAIAMRGLIGSQFILKHISNRKKEYTITGPGIRQVTEYLNRVINLNNY